MNNLFVVSLVLVIVAALITILYAFFIFYKIGKIKIKNKNVEDISSYIRSGAMTFLKREYKIIIIFVLIVTAVLAVLGFIPALKNAEGVGWQSSICFLIGAVFSALTGIIGMLIATKANARTADAVEDGGMRGALRVAFSGGAVIGLCVVGFGLLGLTCLIFLFVGCAGLGFEDAVRAAVSIVSGYGLGCSMIALFARVGGGIYTKAADVGADIVGKIEENLPEDDPRNPATIADNVGDNVGDVAGMGSDLCESYVGSLISCLTLGTVAINGTLEITRVIFPLLIAALGLIAAVISVAIIRLSKAKNAQLTLSVATYIATGIVLVGTILLSIFYLKDGAGNAEPKAIGAVASGLACGILVGKIAEIYTSSEYRKVKEIAKESETGHATNIIAGLGVGMKSTFFTIIVLALGIVVSYFFLGHYGIALAAVGMLSTAGITISVDGYGPIADNAGGLAQMSGLDPKVREVTDHLDSVGNTTAAIGKGFCIGSATLTALALFFSYANAAGLTDASGKLSINILEPQVIVGLLIGAMLPFLFSALVIASVGKAGNKMVVEIRRQFQENPGILDGTVKPDYDKCIDISTRASLKEMILPGLIAVLTPIVCGFVLGKEALGGLLIGGLASAIMLAVFMANAGGAWDNAKKYVEEGNNGGKGSLSHQASITGDTVGDPLKDTAGPAMDILIKLMCIISLIIAPVLTVVTSLWQLFVK